MVQSTRRFLYALARSFDVFVCLSKLLVCVLIISAAFCGCGGSTLSIPDIDGRVEVAKIVVELPVGSDGTLRPGESLKLAASAFDKANNPVAGVAFTWRSSNPMVAEVDQTGLVRAKSPGATDITASAAGVVSVPRRLTVESEEEAPPPPPSPR
ncbi:MAG: Ig-like domain-containing protein [Armatimonadota bacterium]